MDVNIVWCVRDMRSNVRTVCMLYIVYATTCLSIFQDPESLVFARRLCGDCEIDCAVQCPYNVVLEYISRIPDPSGTDHDHRVSKVSLHNPHSGPPLRFFRAVTARGPNRPFTKSHSGKNSMRD